jgi:DNA-binding transcriptional MerR regulator
MEKAHGAFLTISELAGDLGLPQHILRYWETRFPELRPLQRSGNRRYYRPADVVLVRRINQLLNVEGFTVRGARKALSDDMACPDESLQCLPATADIVMRLEAIRDALTTAIGKADQG